MDLKTKRLSSLVKVFADEEPKAELGHPCKGFANEVQSFQIALCCEGPRGTSVTVEVKSPISDWVHVRLVRSVPVELACFTDADDNYLRRTPGMYPDLLCEIEWPVRLLAGQWHSFWVDVEPEGQVEPGVYPIKLIFTDQTDQTVHEVEHSVEILAGTLPPQKLIHTKWFYTDCLAEYYKVEAFSEEHWRIIENFVRTAVKRGINMILTPIHTPPLDTQVGGERLTTQLVDVFKDSGKYSFRFDKLHRWVEMCKRCGVEYYEMAHLFTQWGARFTPKIVATVDGQQQRIFGWDVSATSEEYKEFLGVYLPALVAELRKMSIDQRSYFHISDEPSVEHMSDYLAAKELVAPYLKGFRIMDALSDYEFYKTGAVDLPVPANDHIDPFLEGKVPGLWTYYCISQYKDVSNLFVSMPSARTRIFAEQLYKYDIEGILQWGYNFYNSQYSRYAVNPFAITDADGFTPSGDAFQVYPGADGKPMESIRLMVILHMLQDLRAFELLESLTSKAFVMELIEGELEQKITFSVYPREDEYLLNLRERVNAEIEARLGK